MKYFKILFLLSLFGNFLYAKPKYIIHFNINVPKNEYPKELKNISDYINITYNCNIVKRKNFGENKTINIICNTEKKNEIVQIHKKLKKITAYEVLKGKLINFPY